MGQGYSIGISLRIGVLWSMMRRRRIKVFDEEEAYKSVHLFASYEPYELMVVLFLSGHHNSDSATVLWNLLSKLRIVVRVGGSA